MEIPNIVLVIFQISFVLSCANVGVWETIFNGSTEKTFVTYYPDVPNGSTYLDTISQLLNLLSNVSSPASLVLSTNSNISLQFFSGSGTTTLAFFDIDTLLTVQTRLTLLLHRMRHTKIVFISVGIFEYARVKSLFDWCWKSSMLNVVLLDCTSSITYSYNPFGSFQIYKVAGNAARSEYFPDKLVNLHGEVFRTVSEVFTPTAFLYTNLKGQKLLGGFAGRIFASYVEKHNGTINHIQLLSKDVKNELNGLFEKRLADIAVHLYTDIEPDLYDRSMIVTFGQWCALVPAPKMLPLYMNLIQPFERGVWITIAIGMAYAAVVLRVASFVSGEHGNFSLMFLYSLQTFMYQMGMKRINLMRRRFLLVYAPLVVLGLILNHLYLSHVASFLTSPLRGKGIKSAQDFRKENIRILGVHSELTKYILQEDVYKEYHDLVTAVGRHELYHWRDQFNNSNAIMTESDKIYHILMQQKYFEEEIFSHPGICFRSLSYAYPVRHDFPYVFDLELHLKLVSQAGFIAKWRRDGFEESRQAGFVPKTRKFKEVTVVLQTAHLQMPFMLLTAGIVISFLCFCGEVIIGR